MKLDVEADWLKSRPLKTKNKKVFVYFKSESSYKPLQFPYRSISAVENMGK